MSVEKQKFTLSSSKAGSDELAIIQTMFKTHGESRSMELFEWQYSGALNGTQVVIASDPANSANEGAALVAAFSSALCGNVSLSASSAAVGPDSSAITPLACVISLSAFCFVILLHFK